eukprot:TRINITY_DN108266_c0_g1_i1.p1 TRINITY_DN108266_c0_g1~~TRINITY_DN108266_c0_g1_i1.p1  ORF type:complete len:1198 (-),score=267.36 TRINITY_DN108266_c0_g1_i1:180-3773(-)
MAVCAGFLDEKDDCGRSLIRLLSRGHAVAAELQRAAESLPPALQGEGPLAKRLSPVLPDFAVFRSQGAVERVANSSELIELDEESRELNSEAAERLFRILAAIRKYSIDLTRYLEDVEGGAYVGYNIESILRDAHGMQLLPEAVALLGILLLLLEERIPGSCRERALVLFYRCTVGTSRESDDFADVCRLFKATGRPADTDFASRRPGYPESYFARFPLPQDAVRLVIGQLQTGDVYGASRHYPLPEHRSHGLSAQAGLLYVSLFFQVTTLQSDFVAMREIVDRHFGDAWVVAYSLGCTADLLAMWAPYPAAKQALGNAVSAGNVKQLQDQHLVRLAKTREQLSEYLTEGVLCEEFVSSKTSALINCLRQSNTSIRWLLLQPTTEDPKLKAVCNCSAQMKEQLLHALVETALLEDKVKGLLGPLVARRDSDWARLKGEAAQSMDDLAVYFSGQHALRRNVRNEELEQFFRGLQERIEELSFEGQEDVLGLGRRVGQITKALEEVALFHEVSQQPQILHFLSDARQLLQRMLRTANLSEETLHTVETVADLSYAWRALGTYREAMGGLLAASPDSVKGLRALFLKLASILEAPLRRIRQAGNNSHASLVSGYYSGKLVEFMRAVLQEIPRLIFRLLGQLSAIEAEQPPSALPSRIGLAELQGYALRSEKAGHEIGAITQRIALLMRGIRETDVAVLGVILFEPREVLLDGLRQELACQIEALLVGLQFPSSGILRREDLEAPLQAIAEKAQALRHSFEHLQDYLGVSAMQLWHQEYGRIVRFLLYMEQHLLLRRRLPGVASSPHHDPVAPVVFPDASPENAAGGSFISRTASILIELTDPKVVNGGLHLDFRNMQLDAAPLDSIVLERLMKAIGPAGVAAVARMLGLKAAGRARKAMSGCRRLLADAEMQALLAKARAAAAPGHLKATKALRTTLNALTHQVGPFTQVLSNLGQLVLIKRHLADLLRLHCRLNASLAGEALAVLDEAALAEALEFEAEESPDAQLPSLWDFVGGSDHSSEEWQLRFRRKLARAVELPGFGNPLRQLLQAVPEGTAPAELDSLLALAVLSKVTSSASAEVASNRKLQRGWTGSWGATTPAAQSESARGKASYEVHAALTAGLATMLQQLPRKVSDGTFELCGLYMTGLCAEAADGATQAWAEGAQIMNLLGNTVELLGMPRSQLAEYLPQGLIDLWPAK